uniref:Uncharacterized protein n=1 Tax=Anguilla anguilla TaxID=7936 RepID=A0A0E9W1Q6_ANGAN
MSDIERRLAQRSRSNYFVVVKSGSSPIY